jgi:glycosyltransferase involved in cell wall biosynthesis
MGVNSTSTLLASDPSAGLAQTNDREQRPVYSPPELRLRILLVLEAAGAGVGRHVVDLVSGLLARGHVVDVIYSPARAEASFLAEFGAVDGELTVREFPMQRSVGISDLAGVIGLRRVIRAGGPYDIVHAHSSKAGALLRLASLGLKSKRIYTPHAFITLDPDLGNKARLVYGSVERFLARFTDKIICVSEFEREHASGLGIPAQRLCVIHNGISELPASERDNVRAELGLAESDVCIGTVGRMSHQKAMDRLVHAFADALPSSPNLRLVLVGDGEDRDSIECLVDHLGIRDRVTLTGMANGVRMMSAFDVFALCSRYEACPYVLLEAAGRALPVVMMATGGTGSIVRDGENGFVVKQGDTGAFSKSLALLAGQAESREQMGEQSLGTAHRYSVDHMVDQTLRIYNGIIQ